ncbi:hypothetical protein K435DRAFT_794787 [Dendrothele bispora CBS 962.96]|uniref:Major facilitator superfamily (MFS) profile domain-containing protein n=1 Tax=Dendrothele bispora (strain CBS 962.96) TaxID=1314807 RepID=A0A4S8MAY7_DENBC|nr:hypothetical protein K435DRAFT_794787 [Dendrothele bispora CBS 962.96]
MSPRRLPLIVGNVASGRSFVVGSILKARWPGTADNFSNAGTVETPTTFFFSACIGPFPWAYSAEIYSTRTGAKATALTSSALWILTPIAFGHIGWKSRICNLWSHQGITKETTSRRLKEMNALFEDSQFFIPGTQYTKAQDRHAAERELGEGLE